MNAETMVAISTPHGRGGIGIVRLSGPASKKIVDQMVRSGSTMEHGRARFGVLMDEDGARVDEVVITYFAAPNSYTGDDVVEIAAHGSPVVLEWAVQRAVELGARPARPGEFTERAFLSGRIDLTQAEAVRDLIDAQTMEQARVAAEQVGGSLAARIRPAKEQLVNLIAALEAGIDFAEDDIDTVSADEIVAKLAAVRTPIEALLQSFAYGNILRSGVKLAIVGRPNAGKSSLFNQLVARERSIVTATAGTTRDVVSERLSLGGIPVELMDTAGLRDATEEVERIGIERSNEAMADADLVILVLDATTDIGTEETRVMNEMQGRNLLIVRNKIDLAAASSDGAADYFETSAHTGEGVAALRDALLSQIRGPAVQARSGILTNLRQQDAVRRCVDSLMRAEVAATNTVPHEMILLDVYEGLRGVDELTGQTTADDVLNLIFSSFCIGK